MRLAARQTAGPRERRGVTAVAESTDLNTWTVCEEPFYAPGSYFTHECPDLFRMGDWYYLIFSEFSEKNVTRYRMAKSPDGPWLTPAVDSFDGHAYYAAKSCANSEGRRILFGWNPIRNQEKDSERWQWGGTIIPHELIQNADGTLSVVCPHEIPDAYATPSPLTVSSTFGPCTKESETYTLGNGRSTAAILFETLPEACTVKVRFTPAETGLDFGLILRADKEYNSYYRVKLDPLYNRLITDRVSKFDSCTHAYVETERPFPIQPGREIELTLVLEGSVLEVYGGGVATSFRMFDFKGPCLGIYTEHGILTLNRLAVCV
jgi:beta-fructofuranosidase